MCKGRLVLNMNKDVYTQLGLEGQPVRSSHKDVSRYVVNVNLISPQFVPGKKNYQRVLWCFTDRLNLLFDFVLAWLPHGNRLSCSYFVSMSHRTYVQLFLISI